MVLSESSQSAGAHAHTHTHRHSSNLTWNVLLCKHKIKPKFDKLLAGDKKLFWTWTRHNTVQARSFLLLASVCILYRTESRAACRASRCQLTGRSQQQRVTSPDRTGQQTLGTWAGEKQKGPVKSEVANRTKMKLMSSLFPWIFLSCVSSHKISRHPPIALLCNNSQMMKWTLRKFSDTFFLFVCFL